jgi:hypothetical protein
VHARVLAVVLPRNLLCLKKFFNGCPLECGRIKEDAKAHGL